MCNQREYRDYKKRMLSGSTDGRGILVAATATPGTLLHTALASQSGNEWDEVWLRVTNSSGSAVQLTIEFGGTTAPNDQIKITVPSQSGLTDVVLGHVLQNGAIVRAFAATANVLIVHGFVNRYENTDR